jgi:hypothetical protein
MKRLIIPGLTTKWKYPRPPPKVASKINTAMEMILRFTFTGRGLRRVAGIRQTRDHRKLKQVVVPNVNLAAARRCVGPYNAFAPREPRARKNCFTEI